MGAYTLLLNGLGYLADQKMMVVRLKHSSRNHQYPTMATYTNMPATRVLLLGCSKDGRATRRTMVLDPAMRQFVGPVLL